MTPSDQRLAEIPREWRERVVAVFESGEKSRIISQPQTEKDWYAAFPASWDHDRNDAFIRFLRTEGVVGRHITNMTPTCDTYEFMFEFDERAVLGKIGLLPDNRVIIIFSSHIPRKGDKL